MPLTNLQCRNARASDRQSKLFDGGGLYLLVRPNGSKLWQQTYRFGGKQRTLSHGAYPRVSLAAARALRDEAKDALAAGHDPARRQETSDGADTFETVAREWHKAQSEHWVPKYQKLTLARLEQDLFPEIGSLAIDRIEAPKILDALRKAEKRGVGDTVRRLRQMCSNIFRYAIATGRAQRDPAADLKGALKRKPKVKHHPILKPTELVDFFVKLRDYDGEAVTRLGIEFVAYTFVRTGEARFARRSEFESDTWRIPGERMKKGRDHLVPLTSQIKRIVDDLKAAGGESEWLMPGLRGKPISENTLLYGLYRLGYHSRLTVHGFRGTASTILNESGLWSPDAIERQLAHDDDDEVRAAYNAAQFLPERRRMMQWYSDFLDGQRMTAGLLG